MPFLILFLRTVCAMLQQKDVKLSNKDTSPPLPDLGSSNTDFPRYRQSGISLCTIKISELIFIFRFQLQVFCKIYSLINFDHIGRLYSCGFNHCCW